jgi:hypothetical protein
MSRAVSIHVGVNRAHGEAPLRQSEEMTWRMAELASQAGYQSLRVLRGAEATRHALHRALTEAAEALDSCATLLVTFCGHGCERPDAEHEERSRMDQGWCLADGVMIDDKLAGYWRLFNAGVRIVVVSESCYSGGVVRDDGDGTFAGPATSPGPVMRGGGGFFHGKPVYRSVESEGASSPCIVTPPSHNDGIRASLLLLAASRADQRAREGDFSERLLSVWNGGGFRGSYCDLHRELHQHVASKNAFQEPQLLMLGAPDERFPQQTAFHLDADDRAGAAGPFAGDAGGYGGYGGYGGAYAGGYGAQPGPVYRDGRGYRGDAPVSRSG